MLVLQPFSNHSPTTNTTRILFGGLVKYLGGMMPFVSEGDLPTSVVVQQQIAAAFLIAQTTTACPFYSDGNILGSVCVHMFAAALKLLLLLLLLKSANVYGMPRSKSRPRIAHCSVRLPAQQQSVAFLCVHECLSAGGVLRRDLPPCASHFARDYSAH